jgi:hypothetical protein
LTTGGESTPENSIAPGTYDPRGNQLFLGQAGAEVIYFHDNDLIALPLPEFHYENNVAFRSAEIYRRTWRTIPLAHVGMAFCIGMATGALGLWLGLAVTVTVLTMKVAVFYTNNRQRVDRAARHLGDIVQVLRWFKNHSPKMYEKLVQLLGRAVWEGISSAHQGVTAGDIAALLGRLLGGLASAPESGLQSLLVVLRGMFTTLAVRFPAMAFRGGAEVSRAAIGEFVSKMRQAGVAVTAQDAEAMIRELEANHGEGLNKLRELNHKLSETIPVIDQLVQQFRIEGGPPSGS